MMRTGAAGTAHMPNGDGVQIKLQTEEENKLLLMDI